MSTVKRKCRVIMLQAERGITALYKKTGNIAKPNFNVGIFESDIYQPQHLYILSDDKPKEGDWVITPTGDIIQCAKVFNPNGKKIIATTDNSLCYFKDCPVRGVDSSVKYILPQPSQGFIQKYIEAYNNGKPIEEVTVDYEVKDYTVIRTFPRDFKTNYNPKINQKDNTITISKVKDSWTREEVGNLLNQMRIDLDKTGVISNEEFIKWIEKNL